MLTAKQNMHECVFNGKPDRYVNQYEAISLLFHPYMFMYPGAQLGGPPVVNGWGVTNQWPLGTPGGFPVHTPDKIVIKDIEHWRDYVHAPSIDAPPQLWEMAQGMWGAVDGNLSYKAAFVAPGLFEQTHHLSEMQNALIYYMEYEDEMHDLIKYLTEFELKLAESTCDKLHPDMSSTMTTGAARPTPSSVPPSSRTSSSSPTRRSTATTTITAARWSCTTPTPTARTWCPT